jgi:hypothetical protein
MKKDPTVERIRQTRHEISEQCRHDPKRLVDYYMNFQRKYSDRLVKKPGVVKALATKA